LKRLVRGVNGADDISQFFRQNSIKRAHIALGEALFFEEGGRIMSAGAKIDHRAPRERRFVAV